MLQLISYWQKLSQDVITMRAILKEIALEEKTPLWQFLETLTQSL